MAAITVVSESGGKVHQPDQEHARPEKDNMAGDDKSQHGFARQC